jgi:hypothetical protein
MSSDTPRRSFLRRFWIPIALIAVGIIIEVFNWTTTITAEVLLPQFASSAQMVLGRNVALLFAGFLFIWLVFTKQLDKTVKCSAIAVVLVLAAGFAASIRSIENTGNNGYVFHFRWEPTQDQRLAQFIKIQQGRQFTTARSMHLPHASLTFSAPIVMASYPASN